ncbi:DUF3140 domain-containing protein [Streptomyces albidochromogenes]
MPVTTGWQERRPRALLGPTGETTGQRGAVTAKDATRQETISEFRDTVNLTAAELERWLESDESRGVGQKKDGDDESVGHESGRRIVELLRTKESELDDDDVAHMRKVVGYVRRHLAQRPDGDVAQSPWRYSLKNWGHDPQKK